MAELQARTDAKHPYAALLVERDHKQSWIAIALPNEVPGVPSTSILADRPKLIEDRGEERLRAIGIVAEFVRRSAHRLLTYKRYFL